MATLQEQGIASFYRVAAARDFSRDFQLRVMDIQYLGNPILTQDDLVYARTASLPDRQISVQDIPYLGLNFNVPGSVTYPGNKEYKIEFYSDEELTIRTRLYNWNLAIFNDATSNGNYSINPSSKITLALLDMTGNITQQFILHGVYAVNVGTVEYNMAEGTGKVVTLPATFAYQFWTAGTQQGAGADISVVAGVTI